MPVVPNNIDTDNTNTDRRGGGGESAGPATAIAQLYSTTTLTDAESKVIGRLNFTQETRDSAVTIGLTLFPNALVGGSTHAVHIHVFGDASSGAGLAMGGHFNPSNALHGCSDATNKEISGFHFGDLGNVQISGETAAVTEQTWQSRSLSLFDTSSPGFVLGRGAIVHELADDCATQPTGNAGGRLAQGVVSVASSFSFANPDSDASPEDAIAVFQQSSATTITVASASSIKGAIVLRKHANVDPLAVALQISGLQPHAQLRIAVAAAAAVAGEEATEAICGNPWLVEADSGGSIFDCALDLEETAKTHVSTVKSLHGSQLVLIDGSASSCVGSKILSVASIGVKDSSSTVIPDSICRIGSLQNQENLSIFAIGSLAAVAAILLFLLVNNFRKKFIYTRVGSSSEEKPTYESNS
ncbi:hypothetical protein HK100_008326 [Physocladia obscura]|uniref:Superoxide dismutase copper/zinc binding domain-containing protein n=1 Tax=Physocladia obscura TaxID=109957 RepID=A0AAD5T4B5_9FUNG|nr:hypothetical protein HK100_008326 [Physocladia obscura]